jgi:hypothetical protein
VADAGRLKHKIAGVHHEWIALILIDNAHPAAADDDQLQGDTVEMNPVANRPALRDGDVRSDVAPAEAAGDQIAVEHLRAALAGTGSGFRVDERGRERRHRVR